MIVLYTGVYLVRQYRTQPGETLANCTLNEPLSEFPDSSPSHPKSSRAHISSTLAKYIAVLSCTRILYGAAFHLGFLEENGL